MTIRPLGAELFHADRRTDMTKLIVTFRNFAKAPKNWSQLPRFLRSVYLCWCHYYYHNHYHHHPCYHLYTGCLKFNTRNKPCFYGTQCCSCSVFTISATCNVISPVKYVLYSYISTFRSMCAVSNMAVFLYFLNFLLSWYIAQVLSEGFRNVSCRPSYYRYHFWSHIPHALNFCYDILYFKIFSASF